MELRNKKGVFFTALTILVIAIFLISYAFLSQAQQRVSTEKRIESMSSFLFSIEKDLSRQLYISGFRYLIITEKKISDNNNYISDVNSTFQEVFFNGTFDSEQQEIMVGAIYSDIQNSISQKASKLNIQINLSNPQVEVYQEDPWHIKFVLTLNLEMKDSNNLASWNKTESISSLVPITNLQDPVYYINTQRKIVQNITKTPFSTFISGTDATNLYSHIQNHYYFESTEAPSFLYKLQGITSASDYGIESLVNLQTLSQQGISVQSKSIIDHIYFSDSNPSSCNIVGSSLPSWVLIDSSHLSKYNATCS